MKTSFKYTFVLLISILIWSGCKRSDDYITSIPGPYISNFDLKKFYKGADLPLSKTLLEGATTIKGVVISDQRSGNVPDGLLFVQNSRAGIDSLRGIAFQIGDLAQEYIPGDSVHIQIEGTKLQKVAGILQISGVSAVSIQKKSEGNTLRNQIVTINQILKSPSRYESTLVTIASALVVPEPAPEETFVGDKEIQDGTGSAVIHTESDADFASEKIAVSGNFTGIPIIKDTQGKKELSLWMRSIADFRFAVLPKLSPAIITGYFGNPNGTDGNYEYMQFLATRDIDFSKTPFSVFTANNAGATTFPTTGWITGGVRTYKFNLTSGQVTKGEYFYVGGDGKRINGSPTGAPSTDISSSKWIATANYTKVNGADGIGEVTTNLLANSGNLAGIAIFEGTDIKESTIPLDVIFFGGAGGNFYSAGPPELGLRITNTEYYNSHHPSSGMVQARMGSGTNSFRFGFSGSEQFASLGGVYNATTGRWIEKRLVTSIEVVQEAPVTTIEGKTKLVD